jgi:transaldolase/glucose-6-phosphate isomerase
MAEQLDALRALDFSACVLLGMGGSSLAPEVLRRATGSTSFHVLDTTHPSAIRALDERIDADETLFIAASKSGTTLETRCHVDYFWKKGRLFAAITDPGSELEEFARAHDFAAVVWGEPTIGGRYSALSPFGLVPAAMMGIDLDPFMSRALELQEACRSDDNPGLELGLALGSGWLEGRDKVVTAEANGFGLWLEQLLAESTGKQGKGLVPAPGEAPEGPDRQRLDVVIGEVGDIAAEFYRCEFATAVAATLLEVNPFDQPNVQEAKDRTNDILFPKEPQRGAIDDVRKGSLDDVLRDASPPEYICIQAFIDPAHESKLGPFIAQLRQTGCAVTCGLGPRYLHSTGQLHKGGPPIGRFIQVYDSAGEDVDIPGRPFTFGSLFAAQMAGDFAALNERGRPIARVYLEDIA